VTKRKLRGHH